MSDISTFTAASGEAIPAVHPNTNQINIQALEVCFWDEGTPLPTVLRRGKIWGNSTEGFLKLMLKEDSGAAAAVDADGASVYLASIWLDAAAPTVDHTTDLQDDDLFQRVQNKQLALDDSGNLRWYNQAGTSWDLIKADISASALCPLDLECTTATDALTISPDAAASGGTPTIDGPYESQRGFSWDGAVSRYRGFRTYTDVTSEVSASDQYAHVWESDAEAGGNVELMRLAYTEGDAFAALLFADDSEIGVNGGGELHFRTTGAGFTVGSFYGATGGAALQVKVDGVTTGGSPTLSSGLFNITGESWDGGASVGRSFEFRTQVESEAAASDLWNLLIRSTGGASTSLLCLHSDREFEYFGEEDSRWRFENTDLATVGDPDRSSPRIELDANSWDGAVSRVRSMYWQTEIESPADVDDEHALVLYALDHLGASTEQARFSTAQHLILAGDLGVDSGAFTTLLQENVGAGNFASRVASDFDFADLRGFVVEPQSADASGGPLSPNVSGSIVRLYDGAITHDYLVGFATLANVDLNPGPGSGVYRFLVGEVGGGPGGTALELRWTTDDSAFLAVVQGVPDTESLTAEPFVEASGGTPTIQSPILTVDSFSWDGGSSRLRGLALRSHVTASVATTDEYEAFWGLRDTGGLGGITDYIALLKTATVGSIRAVKHLFRTEIEETEVITALVADGGSARLTFDPEYSGAFAVTRHAYMDFQGVSLVSGATITDTVLAKLPAVATTSPVIAGTTKTTPGTVDKWVEVEIGGVLHHIPAYISTTT